MKKLLIFVLILTAALPAAAGSTKQDRQLEEYKNYKKAYGIAYDSKRDRILVSNIGTYGRVYPLSENLNEDDGYITIRGEYDRPDSLSSGELVLPNVVLNSPAGLQIVNEDTLYICDYNLNQIVIYDLENDSVLNRVYIDTSVYQGLNNICYDNNGSLYLTNVQYTRFYKYEIATGTISEPVLSGETVENPIDMYFDEDNNQIILVSCTDSSYIQAIDLSTFNVTNVYPDKFRALLSITEDNTGHYYFSTNRIQNQTRIYKIDTAFAEEPVIFNNYSFQIGDLMYHPVRDELYFTNMLGGMMGFGILNYPVDLLYPANNAVDMEQDLEFLWTFEKNAYDYKLQISLDSLFENLYLDSTVVQWERLSSDSTKDTSIVVSGLTASTTYYWRVQPIGNYFDGPVSDVYSFTVSDSSKPAPTLIAPVADSSLIFPEFTFEWSSVPNADAYILQIEDKSGFPKQNYEVRTNSTTFTISDLRVDLDYYLWRVKATSGSGGSDWSSSQTFTVAEPGLETPMLLEPLPNDYAPNTGEIIWTYIDGATEYVLEFGLSNLVCDEFYTKETYTLTDTSFSYTDLDIGKYYKVRLRARCDTAVSDFYDLGLRITDTSLATPGVINVESDNEDVSLSPLLSWTDTQADYYRVQVYLGTSSAGRKKVFEVLEGEERSQLIKIISKKVTDNFYNLEQELDKNSTYYWRVRSYTDNAYSAWTELKAFTTGDGSNSTGGDPGENSNMVKVYPNPVENTALIIVNWPDSSDGTVTIYDNMGNKLTTLFSGRPETKVSVLDWDASSVSSGTYYIHVVCGETTGTRKMIISK